MNVNKPTFTKVQPTSYEKTCYEVLVNGLIIGYVSSHEELSYRGTGGWNIGIRVRDYHPTVWQASIKRHGGDALSYRKRQHAVERLQELVRRQESTQAIA